MLKSYAKNVYHCTVCGQVVYAEDSAAAPACCGQPMYLACKAQKPGKTVRNSKEPSAIRPQIVDNNPPIT